MITLGDMVVKIIGDTTGLSNSLTDSQKKMVSFGINAAAVVAAVTQITKVIINATKDYIAYGSAIYDASKRTGLSTDAIQKWKYIAEQSGTTLEAITTSVAFLTRGLDTNAEAFKQLGIETKKQDGTFRSTTDIYDDTIAALSEMENETERNQMAFKLLGRGAQSLIPILNEGASGIEKLSNEAKNLGIILDTKTISNAKALGDATYALKASMQAAKNVMVNDMAPALIQIADYLKGQIEISIRAREEWDAYQKAAKGQGQTLDELSAAIKGTEKETTRLNEALKYKSRLDPKTIETLEAQLAATKALEISLRAQAVALASGTRANELGTEASRKKAEADALAAKQAEISAIAAQKKVDALAAERVALLVLAKAEREAYLDHLDLLDKREARQKAHSDKIIANDAAEKAALIANAKAYAETYTKLIANISTVSKSIFSQLGTDLANQELSWKSMGTAAIKSIGAIISAIGDQLAAKAAARYIEAIAALASVIYAPEAPGLFSSAALLSGGAAGAWTAGSLLQAVSLASGGIASSPMLAMIGDNSRYPEVVAPLSPDVFAGIADGILYALASRSRPAGVTESTSMAARSSSMNSSSSINLNVGTLIADDAGMRILERTLRKFGLQEDLRVGA